MPEQLSFSTDDRSNRSRVLALLSDGLWHSTLELQAVGGTRAPARVHELRRQGYDVQCDGERGRFKYRLNGRLSLNAEPQLSWKRRALLAEARVRELEQLSREEQ